MFWIFEVLDCTAETCQFAGMCLQLSPDESPQCTCTVVCEGTPESEVCGSDRKIHSNQCSMDLLSCHMQMEIYEKPMGFCQNVTGDFALLLQNLSIRQYY